MIYILIYFKIYKYILKSSEMLKKKNLVQVWGTIVTTLRQFYS